MISDRDRRRAFAVCAVCLAAVVAGLLVVGGDGGGGGRGADPSSAPASTAAGAASARAAQPAAETAPVPPPEADTAAADPPPILPAGQPLSRADVRLLRAGPPSAPTAVRAAARRFVEAYLRYELGDAPAALHDQMMALTGGRLRAALQHEPPRRPLGTRLRRGRLSALDGSCERPGPASPPRCRITYVVRFEDRYMPHMFELEKEGTRWLATDLLG